MERAISKSVEIVSLVVMLPSKSRMKDRFGGGVVIVWNCGDCLKVYLMGFVKVRSDTMLNLGFSIRAANLDSNIKCF